MKFRPTSMVWVCGLVCLTGTLISGADPVKKAADGTKKEVKAESKDPPLKGRLPNHFGKLDLTDEQRQTIYKIQDKYDAEIDQLEAKLKELKGLRQKEMEGALTKEQQSRLKLLKNEGSKKPAANSAAKTKSSKSEDK
ncbi:MAG: hypothetical protein U0903_07470 [Planctomycetales bacterium]